jgi:hypothetical protein
VIRLLDIGDGSEIGAITDAQLQQLIDLLEEESIDDRDYYVSRATLELFEARGADPQLVALLREALAGRDDMDIRWEQS